MNKTVGGNKILNFCNRICCRCNAAANHWETQRVYLPSLLYLHSFRASVARRAEWFIGTRAKQAQIRLGNAAFQSKGMSKSVLPRKNHNTSFRLASGQSATSLPMSMDFKKAGPLKFSGAGPGFPCPSLRSLGSRSRIANPKATG